MPVDSRLFTLGIDDLDDQHVELIALLNEMSAILNASTADMVGLCSKQLDRVSDFAQRHFIFEEAHMIQYNYPGVEAHRRLHADIVSKLLEIRRTLTQPEQAFELNLVLIDWLYNHISLADAAYARYYNNKKFSLVNA